MKKRLDDDSVFVLSVQSFITVDELLQIITTRSGDSVFTKLTKASQTYISLPRLFLF